MMFKVIAMLSSPCEHAKYNEILRDSLKKLNVSKILRVLTVCPQKICAPKLITRQSEYC